MLPVAEIFGPTIQGEGIDIGQLTYFVRFAGCDNNCTWCDTPYAKSSAHQKLMHPRDILEQLEVEKCNSVVLTGGNPCMYNLTELVRQLNAKGFFISVETQGTIWHPWLNDVDLVTVSPKGPSSGDSTPPEKVAKFVEENLTAMQIKIVIFGDLDLHYAHKLYEAYANRGLPFVLQVGRKVGDSAEEQLSLYRKLCARIADDPTWDDVRILPQLHALVWGDRRGI